MQLFQGLRQIGKRPDRSKKEQVFPSEKVGKQTGGAVSVKVYEHQHDHRPPRRGDKSGGGGAQRVKRGVHIPVLAERLQCLGDEDDDDHTRSDKADRRRNAAEDAAAVKAYIGRHIHADRAGR